MARLGRARLLQAVRSVMGLVGRSVNQEGGIVSANVRQVVFFNDIHL